jgi:hypothetical protein
VVEGGGGGDVGEDGAFEDYAAADALAEKVGEVDGCVDADGGEGGAVVAARGTFGGGEDAELGDVGEQGGHVISK